MDWLKGMNDVVRYIEKNLTQHIHYEDLARIVGYPVYEFSRIFSFMSGISPSEYIRRRRLSQAVFDIQNSSEKIIDIASKYCYESPAAFTRAFKDLHGTAPLSARKANVPLKNYPAIKFILTIKGVAEMNFRIVERPAFSVVGIRLSFAEKENSEGDMISNFWENTPKATYDTLLSLADGDSKKLIGVFLRYYLDRTEYLIAVESSAAPPEGFEKHTIQAVRWAVMEKDSEPAKLYERVYSEWLPTSGYKRADESFPIFTLYNDSNNTQSDSYNELWFPIDNHTDAERKLNQAKSELAKLEASTTQKKPVDIDLKAMTPHPRAKEKLSLNYTSDGLMVLHTMTGDGRMATPQSFTFPIKIELRAKTDSTNMRLYYGERDDFRHGAWLIPNYYPDSDSNYLRFNDLSVHNEHGFEGLGHMPIGEFVDLEWILGEKVMAVKVNGELRFASCEFEYIQAVKDGFGISGPVYAAAGRGSTVTVEKLRVTEL